MIVLMLTGTIWLTQSLRFVDMIFNHNVSLKEYFTIILFLIPDLISLMLPFSLLVATLMVYNQLYTNHELVVWKACGLSHWRLARPALFVAFFISILVFLLNVYVVPSSLKQLKNLEHQIRHSFSMALMKKGTFNTIKNTTVYIQDHDVKKGYLKGIFIHQSEDALHQKSANTIIAHAGHYDPLGNNGQITLFNGVKQEIDLKTKQLSTLSFEKMGYSLKNLIKKEETRTARPAEMQLLELLNPPQHLNHLLKSKFMSEGHQRLLMPLMVYVYTLCALAFVIAPAFSRRSRWLWNTIACVVAAAAQLLVFILLYSNGRVEGAILKAYAVIGITLVGLILFLVKDEIRWSK